MINMKLTKRENDVYKLLLQGFNKKEIAETLMIAESTVATRKAAIYEKLFVHSQSQLLAKRIQELENERANTAQTIFTLAMGVDMYHNKCKNYKKILKG